MLLDKSDYIKILHFYKIYNYDDKSLKIIRKRVEDIISEKLCRCITKVDKKYNDKPKAIAICNNSVIKKKSINIYGFSCKKKPKLRNKKSTTQKIYKL